MKGKVSLNETSDGLTHITGHIDGLNIESDHGFHIHTFGNLSNNCLAAMGHYNPFEVSKLKGYKGLYRVIQGYKGYIGIYMVMMNVHCVPKALT